MTKLSTLEQATLSSSQHWDIFCTVVDNYGDIGVSWRLAKQLSHDFNIQVRLWVDCLTSFHHILPKLNPDLSQQRHANVDIYHWQTPLTQSWQPGAVLIEAFACELPDEISLGLAKLSQPPMWINLDYLSAEDWIDECHGLPSLLSEQRIRYFFFPGFTPKSGGLLCEHDLFDRQSRWLADAQAQASWLSELNLPPKRAQQTEDPLYISVFSYPTQALTSLSQHWQQGTRPIVLLVPYGRSLDSLSWLLPANETQFSIGRSYRSGSLTVHVLPMTDQESFDKLLWYCDVNIVRGEDSFLRAQWAKKPFLWHIYPQQENAHIDKLTAFMDHYTRQLDSAPSRIWQGLSLAFNQDDGDNSIKYWSLLQDHMHTLRQHAKKWPQQALNSGDLATRLVHFVKKG